MWARAGVTAAALGVGLALLAAAVALARPASITSATVLTSQALPRDPRTMLGLEYPGQELYYATCAKLFNFRDAEGARGKELYPEVARGFPAVSRDGKTYVFEVRSGAEAYRFANGNSVTADTFAELIDQRRRDRFDRLGKDVLSAVARGTKVVVRLREPAPDIVARLTMPPFCADGAGPYYVATRGERRVVLLRNPRYRGSRPSRLDRIVLEQAVQFSRALEDVRAGRADVAYEFYASREELAELARTYGLNRRRFFVRPTLVVEGIAFGSGYQTFLGNPALRRALNYAVDRHALAAAEGPLTVRRTDQVLAPGLPGFRDADLFPLRGSDYATAKRLARGATRRGRAEMGCHRRWTDVLRYNLQQIGIELVCSARVPEASAFDLYSTTWAPAYPDPGAIFGATVYDPYCHTVSCKTSRDAPQLEAQLTRALRSQRPGRLAALARFERDLLSTSAPVVPLFVRNAHVLVSERVAKVVYNPIFGLDLGALEVR